MSFNIFLKPTKAFQYELENPSIGRAVLFILLTSLFLSLTAMLVGGTIFTAVVITLTTFFQWLILSVILWFFEFMFAPKKTKIHLVTFKEIASITGKLWMLFAISSVIFLLMLLSIGTIFIAIFVIVMIVLGLFLVIDSYLMTKVALDIDTKRAIIPWVLLIIVYFLLTALLFNISAATIPVF